MSGVHEHTIREKNGETVHVNIPWQGGRRETWIGGENERSAN